MALPDLAPETKQATDVVTQKVLINGSALSGEIRVNAITLNLLHNKVATATLAVHDGDVAAREFKLSNSDTFKPGNEIEIKLGYHGDVETLFKGIITKHALRSKQKDSSYLLIEAKNKAVKLTIGRKNKYFIKKNDSSIIEEICQGVVNVSVNAKDTPVKHEEMVQYYVSDWDFIVQRAEANGLLVFTDLDQVKIQKPGTQTAPVFTATYGDNIFELETELDARQHYKSIKSYSWNALDQKIEESHEGTFSFKGSGNITEDDLSKVIGLKELSLRHAGNLKDEELNQWSDAFCMKNKLSRVCGKVRVIGNTKVKPGTVVSIKGLSDRFNGNVYVTGVQQQLSVNHWHTVIQFGWNQEWFYKNEDIQERASSGMVPGINGLHTGLVTKIDKDPEGNFRVKVKIPLIDNQEEGIWARVATLDAGNGRGSFFLPEVNDEVILGFIHDDPRQPVVLGMLHSKKNAAPVTVDDKNKEKGFYTRSKMKLVFDDDKSSVTIITPKKKSIEINDKDGTIILKDELTNKITMNSSGISIESSKNINIKAGAKLDLTATGQAVLKGGPVNIN